MNNFKMLMNRYPFVVFLIVVFLVHCILNPFGDDIAYANKIADSPWAFAYERYLHWSSRVLTDALLYWLAKLPAIWWRIADSLVITFLVRNMYRIIFENDDRHVCIFLLGMFIFPLWEMSNAGWMATTVNYIWPFMSFSYVVILIKEYYDRKKINSYQWILYILAVLYSINFEQTVVLLVLLPLYLIAENMFLKRPNNNLIYVTLVLGILGVWFNITCPGNNRRIILEIDKWFPTFHMLSLPDKIMIGVSDTLFHLTKTPVLLYIVFLLCLFIYSHFKFHDSVYDIVNILPIVFVSVSAVLPLYKDINGDSLNHIVILVMFIMVDWLLIFWPLIGMSMIFDDKVKFFRAAMVYLTGFGIRVLMGLSPTVYISGSRTFLPVYLSLLIIIFLVYKEIVTVHPIRSTVV